VLLSLKSSGFQIISQDKTKKEKMSYSGGQQRGGRQRGFRGGRRSGGFSGRGGRGYRAGRGDLSYQHRGGYQQYDEYQQGDFGGYRGGGGRRRGRGHGDRGGRGGGRGSGRGDRSRNLTRYNEKASKVLLNEVKDFNKDDYAGPQQVRVWRFTGTTWSKIESLSRGEAYFYNEETNKVLKCGEKPNLDENVLNSAENLSYRNEGMEFPAPPNTDEYPKDMKKNKKRRDK